MPNALIIGCAHPATLINPDRGEPVTVLAGAAALIAQALTQSRRIRAALITPLDDAINGRATRQLLTQAGILFRALSSPQPTPHVLWQRQPEGPPTPEPHTMPDLAGPEMSRAIAQSAGDYDCVIADCHLAVPLLETLPPASPQLALHGTAADRCLRITATNPSRKAAVIINQEQAELLMSAQQAADYAQLAAALHAERLLVTLGAAGWWLYTPDGITQGQLPAAPPHRNYHDSTAAAAGLILQLTAPHPKPGDDLNATITSWVRRHPL